MEDTTLYLLLKTVHQNKNLNSLIRAGISFKTIGDFTELAASHNLLTISKTGVILTSSGLVKLEELKLAHKNTNKNEWIQEEFDSKIDKLDPNFIYLPLQDELFFDK